LEDLEAIRELARRGRVSSPLSAYWHPGEISWEYCHGRDFGPDTTVWTDDDGPAAWAMVDDETRSADAMLRPDLRGGGHEAAVIAFVEERFGPGPITVHTWSDDVGRVALLRDRGYEFCARGFQTFACPLADPVAVPELPEGFHLLDSLTREWVAERAECHRRAFDRSSMTPEIYAAFRQAPGYDPELDVAVVADDGRVVSYAMAWADAETGTGQLEPVGTRPHSWRQGLGRVATCEALRRLRDRHMVVASVNTWAHHEGNLAFYEGCGFVRGPTIDSWTRPG
jgi:GNAT superfamily N-acetyltransferase